MHSDVTWQPGMTLEDIEKLVILRAIKYYKHNKSQTARALGIGIRTLDSKLERYGEPVQVAKMKTDEMKRKIKQGLMHFFGDRSKVALQLGISVSRLEEYINEIAREEASRGLGLEPFVEVSPQPTLPVPKWQEIQSVLPEQAGSRSPGGLGQSSEAAHGSTDIRAQNNTNPNQEGDGCDGLTKTSKGSSKAITNGTAPESASLSSSAEKAVAPSAKSMNHPKQRGSAVGSQNPRAN